MTNEDDSQEGLLPPAAANALLILFVLAIGLGAFLAYRQHAIAWNEHVESLNWTEATATIQSSNVKEKMEFSRKTGPRTDRELIVSYTFEVDGKTYRGNRWGLEKLRGAAHAEEVAVKYATGNTVPVYYNPLNPEESMLDRTKDWLDFWVFISATLTVVFLIFAKGVFEMVAPEVMTALSKRGKGGKKKQKGQPQTRTYRNEGLRLPPPAPPKRRRKK